MGYSLLTGPPLLANFSPAIVTGALEEIGDPSVHPTLGLALAASIFVLAAPVFGHDMDRSKSWRDRHVDGKGRLALPPADGAALGRHGSGARRI